MKQRLRYKFIIKLPITINYKLIKNDVSNIYKISSFLFEINRFIEVCFSLRINSNPLVVGHKEVNINFLIESFYA